MRYLIHACPAREWFVEGYMVPEMKRQGIPEEEIEIWMDRNGDGNLMSCMKSFEECGKRNGGTWHLQDDVVLASDFAEKTRTHDDGLVCGFGRIGWQSPESVRSGSMRMQRSGTYTGGMSRRTNTTTAFFMISYARRIWT